MSTSKRTRGDLQFILPKEGSSTVSLPKEDSSEITKIIDLHIEDFLGKLNETVDENFIKSPRFLIGHQEVSLCFGLNQKNNVWVDVSDGDGDTFSSPNLMSILVTGNCGNLTFDKRDDAGADEYLVVRLGSVKKLKEAMTTSSNHKLDLQVTLTVLVPGDSDDDQWIIPR